MKAIILLTALTSSALTLLLVLLFLRHPIAYRSNTPTATTTSRENVGPCHVDGFGLGHDVSCSRSTKSGMFPPIYSWSDAFCGAFVTCDSSCNVQKTPEYDSCIDCFQSVRDDDKGRVVVSKECMQKFPGMKNAFGQYLKVVTPD